MNNENFVRWNDKMFKKYHSKRTVYESKNPIIRLTENWRLKTMIKQAQIEKKDKILDLGCGEGTLISLLPPNVRVVGLDVSETAIKKAKQKLGNRTNVELVLGNAEQKNLFEKESFDKILCSEVLQHTQRPEKVIENVYELLKPEGIFVLSIPDEKRIHQIMRLLKLFRLKPNTKRKGEYYEWNLHQTNTDFIRSITKDNFEIGKIKRIPPIIGYRYVIKLKK